MDFLEKKTSHLLQRLKRLQVEQCCLHIDQQIGLWYQNQIDPTSVISTTNDDITTIKATTTTTDDTEPTTTLITTATTQPPPQLEPHLQNQVPQSLKQEQHIHSLQQDEKPLIQQLEEQQDIKPQIQPQLEHQEEQQQSQLQQLQLELQLHPQPLLQPAKLDIDDEDDNEEEEDEQLPSQLISPSEEIINEIVVTNDDHDTRLHHDPKREPNLDTERTIGCFLSNIKHLKNFDSDATESTSSDSYDELEGFSHEEIPPRRSNLYLNHPSTSSIPQNLNQLSPDLKKKAIWKWANERSRLASRWTWLQAQIADLEFRIRGQNDATMLARAYKTPPLPPVLPENSCSRSVPISKDFRRRRLIKSSQILTDSNKKLVKFSHVPCICSSLPQTVAPCLSCNGRYNYLRQLEEENAPLTERISLLDPCCHPVLSFPDDLTLGSQLSYLLKQETINRKPTKGRPGRKKGSTAANLAAQAAAAANSDNNAGKKGKFYHRMVGRPPGSGSGLKNPSQTMITSNKLRRKYRKHSNTNNYDSNKWVGTPNNHTHTTRRNKRIRRTSSMNESSVCSESSNQYRPNHFSNNNSAQTVTRRRRSEQSAYDIDNIVIPFSIAATTRVEILEYKEIMTPSWRVWENGTCQAEPIEEDVEDTSDEAYILRHSKGECEEKKRFSLKPPKNTTTTPTTTPTASTFNNISLNDNSSIIVNSTNETTMKKEVV